uniref:Uncharacterized protein n=1 Tax=Anguilla anguilla TaxID=7936 RepID=A0A0E9VLX5_ANGAN
MTEELSPVSPREIKRRVCV